MTAKRRWLALILLVTAAALPACRSGAGGATPQPTDIPTPVSTPLATLPPTPVVGAEDNPLQFLVVNETSDEAASSAAEDLQNALSEATGLAINVTLADSDRDAVAALCASFDGPPALAFVSALGYSAAAAQGCGFPLLLAEGEDGALTREVIMIASEDSGVNLLSDLTDKTFCRLGVADLATWQAPALIMLANNLTPTSVLRAVVDVADLDTLVEQLAAGDCDAAALYASDFEEIADSAAQRNITRLPQTLAVPVGVVMAAQEAPLRARATLTEALREFARTAVGADTLAALFGADGLALPTDDSLAEWDTFITRTGMDFAGFQG